MNSEFALIKKYFSQLTPINQSVALGIGDDAAILNLPLNKQLVVSVDTLVEGRHFFKEADAFDLGYKSLAVNLSDMAAMGAEPHCFTLALCLPEIDQTWLKPFSLGLASLAKQFNLTLIGGDTTKGPKTISIQILGFIESNQAILRQGAKVGDNLYVTGTLGDAGFALQQLLAKKKPSKEIQNRLDRPTPRVEIGLALTEIAHAMIDISDGFAADLRHLCQASQCGATIFLNQLPLSPTLQKEIAFSKDWTFPLSGGEDYELCFSADNKFHKEIQLLSSKYRVKISRVGRITKNKTVNFMQADNTRYTIKQSFGFDHFVEN